LYATDGSGTCTVLSIGTRITIRQINQAFSLNNISGLTVGTPTNQGNLVVNGNITYNGATVTTGNIAYNYAKYSRTTSQTVSNGTVVVFNNLENALGSDISVNTSTGQVTLAAGRTYRLRGTVGSIAGATAASFIGYGWYNETTSAYIGEGSGWFSPQSLNYNTTAGGTAEAVITAGVTTVVSFRVVNPTNVSSIGGTSADWGTPYAYPWIDIEELGASFAFSPQIATNGNLTVGGNLVVSGNLAGSVVNVTAPTFTGVTPAYTFANDAGASASWYLLGTWNTAQVGRMLYMRILSHSGYNGVANQNQVTELTWATSNGTSTYNGATGPMYAAGNATVNSRLGTGGGSYASPSKFRMVQVSQTQYQVYGYFASYTSGTNYSVQVTATDTWVHSGTYVSTPGGNYLEFTPTTY